MIEYFTAPGSVPFSIALLVMLGLLLFEVAALLIGFGANDVIDDFVISNIDLPEEPWGGSPDMSTGIEGSGAPEGGSAFGRMLAWLYIGKLPILMVLAIFLTIFGVTGLVAQSLLRQSFGLAVPGIIAAPAVFFATLPLVRWCCGGLSRIMPREESSAISTATFVGRTATVTGGDARQDLPAQARLTDRFGTTHYILVEPEDHDQVLANGTLVLLVRQINGRFSAIPNPNAALADNDH